MMSISIVTATTKMNCKTNQLHNVNPLHSSYVSLVPRPLHGRPGYEATVMYDVIYYGNNNTVMRERGITQIHSTRVMHDVYTTYGLGYNNITIY